MEIFNYSHDELDIPFKDLYDGFDGPFDFGITDDDYQRAEDVDFKYFEEWNETIDDELVQSMGFEDIQDFKYVYAIAHIYNNIKSNNGNQTMRDMLQFYYNKASRFFPDEEFDTPPENGNLLVYLLSFDLKHLFVIGW